MTTLLRHSIPDLARMVRTGEVSAEALTRAALAPTLERFNPRHPDVRMHIVEGYSGLLTDMVLADDDFSTIVAAIAQGRATYANIRRFLGWTEAEAVHACGEAVRAALGL